MFRSYDQNQPFLLPPSLHDFVDEGHPAHLINDLVEELDLTALEVYYGNLGQPAYHPRLMLKVMDPLKARCRHVALSHDGVRGRHAPLHNARYGWVGALALDGMQV